MSINELVNFSFKNKEIISNSELCGCYHCCNIFPYKEIKDFTDDGKTALCPKCNIDTVLGDKCGFSLTKEFLESAKKYWF